MRVRGAKLAGRLVDGAVDVVQERAPQLSERAYRTVAVPLMLADPPGAARAVEVRLDGTRDRVAKMAVSGSVPVSTARRVRRDLARSQSDLATIGTRLPPVQARCLAVRSAGYAEVLQTLPDASATRRPSDPLVLAGALAAWIGVLLLVVNPVVATLIGVVAGVITASVVLGTRTRRAGRARIGALAEALAQVDATASGANPGEVTNLDQDRRVLIARARTSKRLDQRGLTALTAIDKHLDDLLVRLVEGELETDGAHTVQATVERYLPDTLEPFLALRDGQAQVRGRSAVVEVADQLTSIETALADLVRRPSRVNPEQQLFRQGEFLRSKFGGPAE
jgi:hypothetical protein